MAERAEKVAEDALIAGQQLREGASLISYGAVEEAIEHFEECGFSVVRRKDRGSAQT